MWVYNNDKIKKITYLHPINSASLYECRGSEPSRSPCFLSIQTKLEIEVLSILSILAQADMRSWVSLPNENYSQKLTNSWTSYAPNLHGFKGAGSKVPHHQTITSQSTYNWPFSRSFDWPLKNEYVEVFGLIVRQQWPCLLWTVGQVCVVPREGAPRNCTRPQNTNHAI